MNKWHATGRLTRDPESRYTPGGTFVVNFGLAVSERYTSGGEKKERVTFIDCDVWAKSAEAFVQYFHKGDGVTIMARLDFEKWTGQDRQPRSKHKATVLDWEFPLSRPKRDEEEEQPKQVEDDLPF